MHPTFHRNLTAIVSGLSVFAISASCSAHFLWVKTLPVPDGKPQAFLFFGENADDEAYHFPDKLADVKIWRRGADNKRTELKSEKLETDDRNGRTAPLESDETCALEVATQYGVYQTMLLNYCAKHVHAPSNDKLAAAGPSKELKLDIVPASKAGQLQLTVLWNGKPLAGAELMVTVGDVDIVEAKTDDKGQATLRPKGFGLIGVMTNHAEDGVAGELDGKKYVNRTYYATLTFPWKESTESAPGKTSAAKPQAAVPELPEPLSSFGAVVADGWLYVYGGHTGTEHDHSAANISQHFRRIRLDGGDKWEDLPMQTPLQGLPLVTHGGKVYRVGGLDARNLTTDDKEDLHSTAEFAEFDPATGKWTALALLPAPRSSHNAAVIGDKLYVVGGWELAGKSPGTWQPATLVYDFANPQAGWQDVKELPYKRRALAAGHWDGKLVALGGMDEKAKISMRVDLFDPATGEWTQGPKLPGAGMAGFGVSAWNLDGRLYVSGFRGIVYRLNEAGAEWEEVARLEKPRFFHQLVPAGAGGGLLAVGGASQDGHLSDIEQIDIDSKPTAADAHKGDVDRASSERAPPASQEARVDGQGPEASRQLSGSRPSTLDPQPSLGHIWPAFRGNGTSLTSARNLPLRWSDTENIAWSIELPGYGQSSPVVWNDAVFVTTMQGDNKETPTILCFDLATGEKRWQREFKSSLEVETSNMVTRSSPTPAVDSERVYAFFESGNLFALDHAGTVVWQRSLVDEYGDFTSEFGVGSSLAETDDAIFVLVNHEKPSYMLAVDKSTGKNKWKVDYPARVAWSSPTVQSRNGQETVIVSAAGVVEAYDAENGTRLWNLGGLSGNTVPSATAVGDWVFVGSQDVASNLAIDLTSGQPQIAWRSDNPTCNFMSPLYQEGRVNMVSRSGVAFCLDARTGKELWKHRLPDTCWASPLGAGERVYFFTKGGETIVARSGDTFDSLADNKLTINEGTRIYGYAAIDGAIILRTGTRLICVGKPSL
ncbi:MAG: PQQ-binding-like beta-propeller repeat protein [Pirellulales bacterium]